MDFNTLTLAPQGGGLLSFLGPILVAMVALIGVWWTASAALQNNRKNLLVGTITAERATWRQDLRAETALFVEAAHEALAKPSAERMVKLHRHRVGIRLRVNPNPEHQLDRDILSALKAIPDLTAAKNTSRVLAELENLETHVQSLLKEEWDKSKREAETGELEIKPALPNALVLQNS